MNKFWPKSSNAEKRLQALGMDAYTLTKELPQLKAVEGYSVDGQTGVLTLDQSCIVQRQISWGVYGETKPTAEQEATAEPAQDESTDDTAALEQTVSE